jgi:endonuclease/exonuclease/phosphatase family metal-dependent hydrolase
MTRCPRCPFALLVALALACFAGACRDAPPVMSDDENEGALELRVLSYNIKHGRGMDGEVDLARAGALIRKLNPDLVVLQEIDKGVQRSGREDQMARLSELTGLEARFGAFMAYQGGHYGIGLLSRFPIIESRNHKLPEGAEPRSALDARVQLPGGSELMLANVHLYATEEQRLAQARHLVETYAELELPMILAGDFNSEPGGAVMSLIEQHWTDVKKGADKLTFSSTDPSKEIDFILHRPAKRFEVVSIEVLDEPLVSDHRPVLAVLRLRP